MTVCDRDAAHSSVPPDRPTSLGRVGVRSTTCSAMFRFWGSRQRGVGTRRRARQSETREPPAATTPTLTETTCPRTTTVHDAASECGVRPPRPRRVPSSGNARAPTWAPLAPLTCHLRAYRPRPPRSIGRPRFRPPRRRNGEPKPLRGRQSDCSSTPVALRAWPLVVALSRRVGRTRPAGPARAVRRTSSCPESAPEAWGTR